MAVITEIELMDYLNTTSLRYKDKGTEIVLECCPYCEKQKGKYDHFYFSKDKGVFICHKCGIKGNLNKFRYDRGDLSPITRAKAIVHKKPNEDKTIISDTDKFYAWYHKERGIEPDILKKYKVGFKKIDGKTILIYQYYNSKNILFNRKYRTVNKKEIWTEKEAEKNYYGLQHLDYSKDTLHVCEGEDDCHALVQLGIKNVVSVPYGAGSYTVAMDETNKQFNTVYLLFDNDSRGQSGAYEFGKKAGFHRCKNVLLPFKDSRECLLNDLDIFDIQKRIIESKEFRHDEIIKASDNKEDFKKHILHSEKLLGRPIKISRFNAIVGGVRLSELTVVTGHTGAGKSTFAYNLAAWCEHSGFNVMIFPFENRLPSVIRKLIEIYSKDSIYKFDPILSKYTLKKDEQWIDSQLKTLNQKNIYFLNKSFNSKNGYYDLNRIGDIIEFANKFYNVNVFVIDHLHYFLKISGSRNPVLVIDETIRQLKIWTEKFNIHIVLLVHPHKTQDDRTGKPAKLGIMSSKGASSISQESDNFWIISKPVKKENELEELKSKLEIHKNREFGKTGAIYFDVLNNRNTYVAEGDKVKVEPEVKDKKWYDNF